MMVLIVGPTLAIYVAVLGMTMGWMRAAAEDEVRDHMNQRAAHCAGRLDGAFREIAAIAYATARHIEASPNLNETELFAILRANVLQHHAVYGAAFAAEPGTRAPADTLFCPYVHRTPNAGKLHEMHISKDVYDWYGDPRWDWWHTPRNTAQPTWSEPYFDEGAGNVLMVTYSVPVQIDGQFNGVTTVDIQLDTLQQAIGSSAGLADELDYVLMMPDGRFVYHWDATRIMTSSAFSRAEELGRLDLVAACRKMVSGDAGVEVLHGWEDDSVQWLFYAPVSATGWAFAARLPESEVLGSLLARMALATSALAATLAAIIACIWFVSGRLASPIRRLTHKTAQIADGDLDARVDGISTRDEIGDLASAFNRMTADLRQHVQRLAEEQSAREKMEHDLDIARNIQNGLLPTDLPQLKGFDIAGWSRPAEQTGGDYYDMQPLPDGRTAISLADVTGHGIGPALVTAVCRAYGRASFPTNNDLGTLMNHINRLLYDDLPANRFVTFVVALLDPGRAQIEMISAGHGPLLYYHAAEDRIEDHTPQGVPFAVVEEFDYGQPLELTFAPGDMLILLTDGFFEWADPSGELFGTERLQDVVHRNSNASAADLIQALRAEVEDFSQGTPQEDDLTAVVIRRQPNA
jgi:sigma-B regulation protein RsbU (phosphoserine phosphatase)